MPHPDPCPLLRHPLQEPSAFTPERLMDDVRQSRGVAPGPVPDICILEFDGDLTDWLVREGKAAPCPQWACFHTTMWEINLAGERCGIIARTIGGPYAVLIAEQLHAAGVRFLTGLTSAGRISPNLPLPCLVVADSAVRDEGTSYHYLAPEAEARCNAAVVRCLERELPATGWPVHAGRVWTTDAPYRETPSQLQDHARHGVLAVEMQAASLFAFGIARHAAVATVAVLSNATDHDGSQFDTGTMHDGLRFLEAIARAGRAYLNGEHS